MTRDIKHRQLSHDQRHEVAVFAVDNGINRAANQFGIKYETAKKWYNKYITGKPLTNSAGTTLTVDDYDRLDSLGQYVSKITLKEIVDKFSLPYKVNILSKYYRSQNIPVDERYLLVYKCKQCQHTLNVLKVFWGYASLPQCPNCQSRSIKIEKKYYLPFYNPHTTDYFFDRGQLETVNTENFKQNVSSKLSILKDLNARFLYSTKPTRLNKVHIIRTFEKTTGNIVPVTYCGIKYPVISKRIILNPRYDEIDTKLVCLNCQTPYLQDYNKYGDRPPKDMEIKADPYQQALKLFMLAELFNNKMAQAMMGISKSNFYYKKKKYKNIYDGIKNLSGGIHK